MTKADRAKMLKWLTGKAFPRDYSNLAMLVEMAVTRAVRAERKSQRDTEELWASHRRRVDEQMLERAQGLGRKRP